MIVGVIPRDRARASRRDHADDHAGSPSGVLAQNTVIQFEPAVGLIRPARLAAASTGRHTRAGATPLPRGCRKRLRLTTMKDKTADTRG